MTVENDDMELKSAPIFKLENTDPNDVDKLEAAVERYNLFWLNSYSVPTDRFEIAVDNERAIIDWFDPACVDRVYHEVDIPDAIKNPTLLTPAYKFNISAPCAVEILLIVVKVFTDRLDKSILYDVLKLETANSNVFEVAMKFAAVRFSSVITRSDIVVDTLLMLFTV